MLLHCHAGKLLGHLFPHIAQHFEFGLLVCYPLLELVLYETDVLEHGIEVLLEFGHIFCEFQDLKDQSAGARSGKPDPRRNMQSQQHFHLRSIYTLKATTKILEPSLPQSRYLAYQKHSTMSSRSLCRLPPKLIPELKHNSITPSKDNNLPHLINSPFHSNISINDAFSHPPELHPFTYFLYFLLGPALFIISIFCFDQIKVA